MLLRVSPNREGRLVCSRCGVLTEDDTDTCRNVAWNHLLEKHRKELVDSHSEVAVRTAEVMR